MELRVTDRESVTVRTLCHVLEQYALGERSVLVARKVNAEEAVFAWLLRRVRFLEEKDEEKKPF
jgi:hypothetical protein